MVNLSVKAWNSGMRSGVQLASRTVRRFVLLLAFPVMILLWIAGRPLYRSWLMRQPEGYYRKRRLIVLNEMTLRRQIGVWWHDFKQNPSLQWTTHLVRRTLDGVVGRSESKEE